MNERDATILRRYRRVLLGLAGGAAAFAAVLAAVRLVRGRTFHAFLAVCAGAYLVLVITGYRREERGEPPREPPPAGR